MNLTPDATVYWQYGFVKLNATLVMTWLLMLLLTAASWRLTRGLTARSRWYSLLETVVLFLRGQIRAAGLREPDRYLGLLGTLFLFTAASAVLGVLPGYEPATASLSTTAALALCVFAAVPCYGIRARGLGGYLRRYVQPNPLLLPFNILTDLSRTLALAVRLFGNMASDTLVVGILLLVAPLLFPVALQLLGLLTGLVQSYIFTVLALVYIAAGVSGKEG